jgi:arylsulfatase A-like enzyme
MKSPDSSLSATWLRTTLLVMVTGSVLPPQLRAEAQPNIVVILADDLGYGDLSSFGAKDLQTPQIDSLVSRGVRMDEFYANCPVCSPTRASLMTGRYPELVGVPGVIRTHSQNSWGYLDPNCVLLPELLGRAGYQTALVGKWHLGLDPASHPMARGFETFHGFLGDMMDDYYHHRRHEQNYMRNNREVIQPQGHATDLFSQWSCEYIRDAAKRDEPFFLYLAYNAPHTPIQPPQDWLDRVKKRQPDINPQRAKLVALIEHMDHGIGQVVDCLDEVGVAKNTLVIFTSDNGGQSNVGANNGPLRDGKQSVYEGGLKVPLCAVWPGKIAPGSQVAGRGITMDLFATTCEAADAKVEHVIDGTSWLNEWTGGKGESRPDRDLFFHRREGGERYGGLTINAVRRGPWKLLQNSPFSPLELYNLATDPLETNNLTEKHRPKFAELSRALRQQIQRGGAVPWQPHTRREAEFPELTH